jgi:hypothetical protein
MYNIISLYVLINAKECLTRTLPERFGIHFYFWKAVLRIRIRTRIHMFLDVLDPDQRYASGSGYFYQAKIVAS